MSDSLIKNQGSVFLFSLPFFSILLFFFFFFQGGSTEYCNFNLYRLVLPLGGAGTAIHESPYWTVYLPPCDFNKTLEIWVLPWFLLFSHLQVGCLDWAGSVGSLSAQRGWASPEGNSIQLPETPDSDQRDSLHTCPSCCENYRWNLKD